MRQKRIKHRITWEGKEYELGITAISRLTKRSRTFIDARLHEGMTVQQAIDAVPGDPKFKKKRRDQHLRGQDWFTEQDRKNREEQIRQANRAIITKFLGGIPC